MILVMKMSDFEGNRHSSYLDMGRYEERSFQGKRENGDNVFGNQKKRKWNQWYKPEMSVEYLGGTIKKKAAYVYRYSFANNPGGDKI